MSARLTPRQEQIVAFIKNEIDRRGYPPSIREIGAAVELKSTAAVLAQLRALEKKGVIRRDGAKRRAIELLDRNGNGKGLHLPITVHNGSPTGETALLRIDGETVLRLSDAMPPCRDAQPGDYVVLTRPEAYRPGDLLLVDRGGLHHCFRCSSAGDASVTLDTEESLTVDPAFVMGRVAAVIRKFD